MHELGVAFHIIDECKEIASKSDANKITKVTLQIGTVSTIIPSYLEDVWKWACNKENIMNGCDLVIEPIEAVTYCEDCGHKFDTIKFAKICPKCGSDHTYLLTGNEMIIKEIEVE